MTTGVTPPSEHCPTPLLELQNAALVIDNTLQEEHASHPPKSIKSSSSSTTTPKWGVGAGQQATRQSPLSSDPNFVLEEEHNCCQSKALCIKCEKTGHKFAGCTRWKARETAKVAKSLDLL
ncbi:hypothetical protein RhiXN_12063 [Rhizoctonia solani]|uniref:CCHC-type domain-containing protein n=1 Tax=Rhizoctonia solani TaxID=456999 RepID=A0A8H8PAG6_9AGAM|nr:uncharacterized protein RhiXN_12063 [Rhizoctonia solani]QRW26402.1 hypothetical protein RhiXN_12063 [Rhizoctonia solani]